MRPTSFFSLARHAVLSAGLVLTSTLAACAQDAGQRPLERPNILLVLIDDQNDLVATLGHPAAQTPNLDKLARRSTLFTRAYCSAPSCGPSRASLLTGVLPSTSGIYYNSQPDRNDPREWMRNLVNLPLHFKNNGFVTGMYGKIFHAANQGGVLSTYATPSFFSEHTGFWANIPEEPVVRLTDYRRVGGSNFAWGAVPDDWERPGRELIDTENAGKVVEVLARENLPPFFLSLGFLRPHLPWVVPQRYFDLFPLESIGIPEGYRADDLDDLPESAKWMALEVPGPRIDDRTVHGEITRRGDWKAAIQAYLASMAYMDAQLGRVLDALAKSDYADNTIVVVASDHGYHLGEKEHWTKFGLWEKSVQIPLLVALPGQAARRAQSPVSLIDLYPTLVSLAGLEPPTAQPLEGEDLTPLLHDPARTRSRPVLSTYGYQNHTLRDDRYRYIRYRNGDEELYDHTEDPHEFHNLARSKEATEQLAKFRKLLPAVNEPEKDDGGNLGWESKVFQPGYLYPR